MKELPVLHLYLLSLLRRRVPRLHPQVYGGVSFELLVWEVLCMFFGLCIVLVSVLCVCLTLLSPPLSVSLLSVYTPDCILH